MPTREVDPGDEAAFAAWFAVLDASLTAERPGEAHWTLREQRELARSLVRPGGDRGALFLAVVEDDRTVGNARVLLPARDNPHLAQVSLHVHPDVRRRGHGRALLQEVVRRSRAAGRSVLVADLDEGSADAPGRAFAERVGAVCRLLETRRDLVLPVDPVRLAALEQDCRPYAAGYELVHWRDRTPGDWQEQRAELAGRMSSEVPLGDLPFEQEDWDVDRLRAYEDDVLAQGRTWFTVTAAYGGRLVAFSDVGVALDAPERAYQWSTLVLPGHRGHRLGTLVKIAVLRDLQAALPQARLLTTFNAQSNAPMIAVNEALGFRAAGTLSQWTLDLAPVGGD